VRGTHLVASDLSWDLMLVSSHLCLSTIGHRIFGFSCLGLSCLIAFFRLSSDAGLALVSTSPRQESSSLKQFLQATGCICWKEQSVFHLSEPSPSACKLLGGGQAVAEPTKPCPLLKIHKIHVGSQWLSLLSVPSSKDPRGPRDPRGQSVAKPTERALF
jgi:hypothetical protein